MLEQNAKALEIFSSSPDPLVDLFDQVLQFLAALALGSRLVRRPAPSPGYCA
jgi:hypothetical protein